MLTVHRKSSVVSLSFLGLNGPFQFKLMAMLINVYIYIYICYVDVWNPVITLHLLHVYQYEESLPESIYIDM